MAPPGTLMDIPGEVGSAPRQPSRAPGVLHISANTALGGMERVALSIIRLMEPHGLRGVIACHRYGELASYARMEGFDVETCGFDWMQRTLKPGVLLRYAVNLRRESARIEAICREKDIRILQPHGHVSALYARKAALKLRIPMVLHVHDARPPTGFSRLAQRYFEPAVSRVVCVSEASARMMRDSGMPPEKVQVIHNSLSHPAYLGALPEPTPEVTGPGPHFGQVALIVPFKGQMVFLEAAKSLLRRLPTAQFYIIGPLCHPDHQDFLDELRRMADAPRLKGHVTFTGQREDVPRWVMAMDALVMASTIPEAFPSVVLEAMALGRRMVATNHGGQLEIIRDGETGLLVPPNDAEALAEALYDLATRPEDDPMGRLAMSDVRNRFGPERFVKQMTDVYSGLLAGGPAHSGGGPMHAAGRD